MITSVLKAKILTVTAGIGLIASSALFMSAQKAGHVQLCHKEDGNMVIISVDSRSAFKHMAHGDLEYTNRGCIEPVSLTDPITAPIINVRPKSVAIDDVSTLTAPTLTTTK